MLPQNNISGIGSSANTFLWLSPPTHKRMLMHTHTHTHTHIIWYVKKMENSSYNILSKYKHNEAVKVGKEEE